MQVKRFNQKNTAKFIYKIRDQFPGYRIDLVCDNAPWHNGKLVKKALAKTRIREHRLPPYSPQMNASEYFIRWSKEILSYNFCWKDLHSLKYSFRGFVASLSRKTKEVIQRCKPKMFGFNIV
jgi:transposase